MYGRSRVYVKVEPRLCLRMAFHTLSTWLWVLGDKQKESSWGSAMKNTFPLPPSPHPQASQPGTNFNASELVY